jgi:hypothetical protein
MPRGGPRPNSGGRREGAGRKKGSPSTRTTKTNALAQQAAGEGALPLEVMLLAMRHHLAAKNLDRAAAIAKDAAPYLHPRLQAVELSGPGGSAIPHTHEHSGSLSLDQFRELPVEERLRVLRAQVQLPGGN